MWPAARSGLARSKAFCASTSRASACTIALLAWAMAAVARAWPASFWASWASRVSATSRASTSPFLTRKPSSASTSVMRRPSTSGPTRISSRATSEPVASTVAVKSAGATRATVTAAASASRLSCGISLALVSAGPVARGSVLPTSVSEIIRKQSASTAPINILRMADLLPRGLVVADGGLCRRGTGRRIRFCHGIEERADQRHDGRHDGLGIEAGIDGAAPEHAVGHQHERPRHGGNVQRRRDAPLVVHALEQLGEAFEDVAVDPLVDLADARIARGFEADLHAHAVVLGRIVDEISLAQLAQRRHEVAGGG